MVWRVGVGAFLSSVDAATDVYVVATYYSKGFFDKGNYMLAMIVINLCVQLVVVATQYKNRGWKLKVREVLFTLLFLRPIVDAYRISTNHEDEAAVWQPLAVM